MTEGYFTCYNCGKEFRIEFLCFAVMKKFDDTPKSAEYCPECYDILLNQLNFEEKSNYAP